MTEIEFPRAGPDGAEELLAPAEDRVMKHVCVGVADGSELDARSITKLLEFAVKLI
jgi:hypothetical protein